MLPFYIIIGTPGSGRSEVLADLIEFGFNREETAIVYYHKDETPTEDTHPMLKSRKGSVSQWEFDSEKQISLKSEAGNADAAFLVINARLDLLNQLEAVKQFLPTHGVSLARIITVVDCGLLYQNSDIHGWFDAAIHFSDVILLNRRENLQNKWVDDLKRKYSKIHYPCLFALVKKGRVENPAEILFPEPRRMSLYFDEDEESPEVIDTMALYGIEITDEATHEILDEEDLLENEIDEGGERPGTDKYMEKRPNGERFHRLPDISRKFQ